MKKIILPSIIAATLQADQQDVCDDLMHKTHTQLAAYKSGGHTMSKLEVDNIKLTIKLTTRSCDGLVPLNTITSLKNVYKSIK
jgi:hypothetical protein